LRPPFTAFELAFSGKSSASIHVTDESSPMQDKPIIRCDIRSSTILDSLIGRKVAIYNGKTTRTILINEDMTGYKIGSFVLTKKLGKSIHNSEHNRKKIEKQRRKITQKKIRKSSKLSKKPASKSSKKKAKK